MQLVADSNSCEVRQHIAASEGMHELVEYLLESMANVNSRCTITAAMCFVVLRSFTLVCSLSYPLNLFYSNWLKIQLI